MSSESLDKAYATQIANIEKASGKKIAEWATVLHNTGLAKHGELVSFLKEKHGFTHGNANMLVHCAKQIYATAPGNEIDWIAEQYKGKENLKPWYDKLMKSINGFGNDVEVSPKKAYVSLRRKKQFAIIQPSTKARLDVGVNIKGLAPAGNIEASGNWNAMCTHRIRVEDEKYITKEVIAVIKQAYDQAG